MFVNGLGDRDSIPGRIIPKTQKMVLDAALLNTQHYQVRTDCISHNTNTLGKGMNPIILSRVMSK